ncbi:MAG: phosphopantetheine-binding protein [Comamonadaceae bacterium]|nr:phosphopantetheine-binding protein [Comamonadaceae bacterium]
MSGYWGDPDRNRAGAGPAAGRRRHRRGCASRPATGPGCSPTATSRSSPAPTGQVKVRGHRVELEEVEAALLSLASVEEAAVFTVPDGEGSSALRAVVVVGVGRAAGRDRRSMADLRRILPPHALPSRSPSSTPCLGRRPARSTWTALVRGCGRTDSARWRMTGDPRRGLLGIESRVLAFLQRELLEPGVTIARDAELLSGEVIDSIGALRLAAFLEEEFRIDIQPSDFVIENFRSVAVIAGYVGRAAAARGLEGERP